ncbi:hypothetical protein LTR56_017901 [Elasticomyces elasticus]|nr:hypothetical protein LTR56_017901 [Elasticomyces elasticus]KAK3637152.1 hypothetical protein LTR22_018408 [Elasticomyces elasticus]KAK4914145.1 hypothetical protein LTR49_017577 [Elasticomyces elasticus]
MCWEKFSPLSSEAQRNLVTDDKVSVGPKTDHGDVSIDPAWEKVRPKEGMVESATPELMTYFTYLHGLYPLNFTRYIHKPHRFLKDGEFPGAKDFDLEQAVILRVMRAFGLATAGVTLNRRRQYPRKYANSVEANLTRKLKDLKKEQESWNAQADELQRLLVELIKYRDILVRTEQRELEKSMALEIYKRKDENRQDTDKDLRRAQLKLREYEAREFEMEKAKREVEVLIHEKESLQLRARREQHEFERDCRSYVKKVTELEKQLEAADGGRRRGLPAPTADTQAMMHQAITDSQGKLNQLRKKHTG